MLLIFLLFFPFLISVDANFDAQEKQVRYLIKFCGIRIIDGRAVMEGTNVKYYNTRAWFVGDKKVSEILPLFFYILFSALDVLSLDVKVCIGNEDNPAISAWLSGLVLAALGDVYGYFKTKNPKAGFKKNVVFVPQENVCRVYLLSFIGVSIFNVIKSLVLARIEKSKSVQTKREVNNEKHD